MMGMKIAGLQKVSTIDYPGEICCVVFLWGCNFRCGFCYNPDLVVGKSERDFSKEEVLEFLKKRVGKLDGVCISGGEPLMSLNFDFVRKIKEMGFKVKIDTNGSFPERLKEMVDSNLVDYIAMDVKGARGDYEEIVQVSVDIEKIEESIRIVNGFEGEFRTTVVPGLHDVEKLRKMGEWMNKVCEGKPKRIFLQGFKWGEGMIDLSFAQKGEVLGSELIQLKDGLKDLFNEVGIRV